MKLGPWQITTIFVTVVAAIVVMAIMHENPIVIVGILNALGLGGLFAVQSQNNARTEVVAQQTNGNTSAMLAMLQSHADRQHAMLQSAMSALAQSTPPTDGTPSAGG